MTRNRKHKDAGQANRQKATLRSVAQMAGVSVATVSRVMTGKARVSEEVAARVLKSAGEIGVDLNRWNKSRLVAFLLCNRAVLHPFHSHILLGAEATVAEQGWNMLFITLRYSPSQHWRDIHIPHILERHDLASGFIIAGTSSQNLLDHLRHERLPFAVLGNNVLGEWSPEEQDVVWFDDIQGAIEVTRYLLSLGHREIWFVGNTKLPWYRRRFEGYRQAMQAHGLPPLYSEIDSEKDEEIGFLATKSLVSSDKAVTAIFAGGDPAVQGVYKALRDCGLRVPEDVSVAGFNDVEAPALHPPVTSVRVFTEQVGRQLSRVLLNRIEDPGLPNQRVTIPTQLIKRESCHQRSPEAAIVGGP
jgi:LacI family transcriptional regulator, galactose operon repressor